MACYRHKEATTVERSSVVDSQTVTVAAEAMVDPGLWRGMFEDAFAWIGGVFGRREPRLAARDYLLAVLSDVDTRNGWTLAEQAGHANPWRLQSLLGSAVWDADELRDRLRDYVVYELGHRGGVLIVDDSGDLKSGLSCSGLVTTPTEVVQEGPGLGGDARLGGDLLGADGDGG
jgi:hypothetical protein